MSQNAAALDPLDNRRRRAIYRASHRGTKELDLILGAYADVHIKRFDEKMLARFEILLEHEETQLQHWLMGKEEFPAEVDGELLHAIKNFQHSRSGLLTRDPSK